MQALLDFQMAHSRARDAVHGRVDFDAIAAPLAGAFAQTPLRVRSRADDRAIYLRRPDLGRRVHADDLPPLQGAHADYDLVFVVADGLSAAAVNAHAVPLLRTLAPRLAGWTLAPIVLASQARVALGDEVAVTLGARLVAVLIGERPGLSVADSLGIYLTYAPRIGCADSARNCISNIHADGLGYARAADTLMWLLDEARRRRLTGVDLKLDAPSLASDTDAATGGDSTNIIGSSEHE
ncbi:ethanolamine ammonia-lyase subunit EutC [Solimonas soli]|uniref:ethanolamine ammonia-lyase subunit EutC n=1 Tax=Solimonas soli TaxID=413479 RepID=UPI0004AF197F|nr:ethanolamine ammonia-lyase subunit EutC [Solimonas soli]